MALVTLILMTQLPPTGMLPPESASEPEPSAPVMVPLQPGLLLASNAEVAEAFTSVPPPALVG